MMIVLMIVIHKLLVMLGLWLSAIDIRSAKHLKKDRGSITACNRATVKSVGLV